MQKPRIRRVTFENFKGFAAPQELTVRPLTLLFGRNSSGKSAVARIPEMLLGSGRVRGVPGVAFEGDHRLTFGTAYEDLVHARRRDRLRVGFEVDGELGARVSASIVPAPASGAWSPHNRVEELTISDDAWTFTLKIHEDGRLYTASLRDSGEDIEIEPKQLNFDGIFPSSHLDLDLLGPRVAPILQRHPRLRASYVALQSLAVDHLGPTRHAPEAWWAPTVAPWRGAGLDGSAAKDLLADANQGRRTDMVEKTSRWFERIGWECKVDEVQSGAGSLLYSLHFRRVGTDAWIPAPLLGTGTQQVLPVVVQQVALQLGHLDPAIAVVEEPESHLHPAAHDELADLFVETATTPGRAPIVVETHSEVLLLRVRRRVAEGTLKSEQVALHFIDDRGPPGSPVTVHLLEIGRDGWVEGWPDGVFEEGAQERRALARAMRAHG